MRMLPAGLLALALAGAATGTASAQPATSAQFEAAIARTKKEMMGDPKAALASARRALAIARALPPSPRARVDLVTAQWLHGEALIFQNDLAAAAPIIGGALTQAERVASNTKLHGDLLRSRGAVNAMTGKVTEALRDYQRAHDVFQRAGEARSRALALQDIGLIYWDAGDYDRTLAYYNQSAEAFSGDAALTMTMQNNRGEVLRKQKRHDDATAAYRAALVQAKTLGSPMLQTRILTNIAGSEAEAGRLQSAQAAVTSAMALSAHGEAAGWRPFVFGAAARVAAKRGDDALAVRYLENTFRGVDFAKSDLLFRDYHATAADVYERRGDVRAALAHVKAFQRLDREAQNLTASAASQLLAARFDFANQDLKISTLKQGQLRRDIEIERQRTRYRTNLFGGVLIAGGLLVALLLLGFFSIRRSRNKVRDANTTLSQVNGALEKALQAKTEFLATTSHEIRTPLNGILGMTQVLLADRRIDGDVRDRIKVVHGAGETMRALVDDILDVAKMESGKLTVESCPTDLRAILADVAQLWQGQATTKGLALRVDLTHAPERIVSDGARIRQIVFNLMSNAIKFTQAGEVALSVRADADADGAEQLVVVIRDTGMGIPADQQDDIFEAFRQVDGGVTRQFGGTGLGLAICRNLAHALGGDLSVASAPGEGAAFTLRLPLVRAESAGDAVAAGRGLSESAVLLVESDPAVQGLMRMLLAAEAASTEVASDCADAAAILAAGGIDHVVVNAGAAGDGAAAIGQLRIVVAAAGASGARCTLLVSSDAGPSIAAAMLLGASQIVVKPIGGVALVDALASLYGDDAQTFVAPALLTREAA